MFLCVSIVFFLFLVWSVFTNFLLFSVVGVGFWCDLEGPVF
jgi:hypothetical protein